MIFIREATSHDCEKIIDIYMHAFENDEAKEVATLATNLLNEVTNPIILNYIAEYEDNVVGHIAFSPVTFDNDDDLKGYILAPLGVKSDYQKRGIGSNLIRSGIDALSREKTNLVFVYGNPKYYEKFGFSEKIATQYMPPYKLEHPFGWLALSLDKEQLVRGNTKISCVESLSKPQLW